MIRLNLKLALRNLWRNKTSSIINVLGLAVGVAACLLLLLYVNYEWNFDRQYKDASKIYQVMTNFQDASEKITGTGRSPAISICISCMGLYGLAAYSAEQRTKEFGVRRVLGASVGNIMKLLSLSFLKMVFVAACIGVPIAYYLMNRWLMGFEFRTTLSMSIVLVSVVGTALIAFLTISVQAYKSAMANPVEALKYE